MAKVTVKIFPQEQKPKVILITGCSSGFGLLIAARLSKNYRVYATMRNLEKKQALLDEVKKREGRVEVLELDVTKPDTIKSAVSQIIQREGRIDVLVNNAGYGVGGFFEDLTPEEIRAQFDTNFFGQQNAIREVLPFMRQARSGKIITVTSIAGFYSSPAFGSYNSSKWALEGFLEGLYYELKPFDIQVCAIEPGSYNTNIFQANRRYAKGFDNPKSPYYERSQFLNKKVLDFVSGLRRGPESVACLAQKLIESENPPFRNFADPQAKIILTLKRILPFGLFSVILYRVLFLGLNRKKS